MANTQSSSWLPIADEFGDHCFYTGNNGTCLLRDRDCPHMNSFRGCAHARSRDILDHFDAVDSNNTHTDCRWNGISFQCTDPVLPSCMFKSTDGLCGRGLPVSNDSRGAGMPVSINTRGTGALRPNPSNPSNPRNLIEAEADVNDAVELMLRELSDDSAATALRSAGRRVVNTRMVAANASVMKLECHDTDCKWNDKNACKSIRSIMDTEHRCQSFQAKDPGADKEYTDPISNIDL